MQRTCLQHRFLLRYHFMLRRAPALHFSSLNRSLPARQIRLRTAASAQDSNDTKRPADQKPTGSAGSSGQKSAAEKARDSAQAAAAGKPAAGSKSPPQPAQKQPPAPQPAVKPQPARQPAQPVSSRGASQAPAKPQAQPSKPAWDQAAASDWGPTESKRDFLGTQ